jgi:hypothetical protein
MRGRSQKPEEPTDENQNQEARRAHWRLSEARRRQAAPVGVLLASGFWLLASAFWLLPSGFFWL